MARSPILQVLGHDLRWELASLLRGSDLRVGELSVATGEPQNLVSYHLRLLRDAGVVRERRSSADSRDVYYSLNRAAVTAGLMGALEVLSPGVLATSGVAGPRQASHVASVVFLCTGNSARSQIAELMLRNLAGRSVLVRSAGTYPVGVHPQVQVVLASHAIEAGELRSKSITEFAGQVFDYAVTLCDVARAEPVELGGKPRLVHWSIQDPVATRGGKAAVAKAFERTASEIEVRVGDFYRDLLAREPAA